MFYGGYRGYRGVPLFAMLAWCGCDGGVAPPSADRVRNATPFMSVMDDLGDILAGGRPISHEFELDNPTGVPVHILGAEALSPCCSSLACVPEMIPPCSRARVSVIARPGFQAGRREVRFAVHTDEPGRSIRDLILRANFLPEVEILPLGEEPDLPVGQTGTQTYEVVCRRKGGQGRDSPDEAVADGLTASLGAISTESTEGGLTVTTRVLRIAIPPSTQPGPRAEIVRLKWPGDLTLDHTVIWRVAPAITATPAGLIIRSGEIARPVDLAVRSDGDPFRVLDVTGPSVRGWQMDGRAPTQTSHRLELHLDPEFLGLPGNSEIAIRTDHANQPVIRLPLFVLPGPEGGR